MTRKPRSIVTRWQHAILSEQGPDDPITRLILVTLSMFMNPDGSNCFPSIDSIQQRAGVARKTAVKYLGLAELTGWIRRSVRGGRDGRGWKRNQYTPLFPERGARRTPPNESKAVHAVHHENNAEGGAPDTPASSVDSGSKVVHAGAEGGVNQGNKVVHPVHSTLSVTLPMTLDNHPTDGAAAPPRRSRRSARKSGRKAAIRKNGKQPSIHAESTQAIVAHIDRTLKANGLDGGVTSTEWPAARKKVENALMKRPEITVESACNAVGWSISPDATSEYIGRLVREDAAKHLVSIWTAYNNRDKVLAFRQRNGRNGGPPSGEQHFHDDDLVTRD